MTTQEPYQFKDVNKYVLSQLPHGQCTNTKWHPFKHMKCNRLKKRHTFEWERSGSVVTWYEEKDSKCCVCKTIVRGDGKVLSVVDKLETPCSFAIDKAEIIDGHFKGVDQTSRKRFA